jgi:hypothetical protein
VTALDVLATLAAIPAEGPRVAGPVPPARAARWCPRCGAPRNLGRSDCPGCVLLARARERVAAHLARHGMPPGGAVELARLADVPLRAVGAMMTGAPGRGYEGTSRSAR